MKKKLIVAICVVALVILGVCYRADKASAFDMSPLTPKPFRELIDDSHYVKYNSVVLPAFLLCVRHRESRDNYTVVNRRSGAGGAFQFLPSTWRNVVKHAGRRDLLYVAPNQATRRDQDKMAIHLMQWMGRSPWKYKGTTSCYMNGRRY